MTSELRVDSLETSYRMQRKLQNPNGATTLEYGDVRWLTLQRMQENA